MITQPIPKYFFGGLSVALGGIIMGNSNHDWLGLVFIVIGVLIVIHAYLQYRNIQNPYRFVIMLWCGMVGSIFVLLNSSLNPPPPIEAFIHLKERVGNHWQFAQSDHVLLDGSVLLEQSLASGECCRLTPEVCNHHNQATLTGVVMFLRFPDETEMDKNLRFWRRSGLPETRQHYFARIGGEIPANKCNTVDETLHFKLPAGNHRVTYSIGGSADGRGFREVSGAFEMVIK